MNQDGQNSNGFISRLRAALKGSGNGRHQERRLQNAIQKIAIKHQADASSQGISRAVSKKLQHFNLSEEERQGIIAKIFQARG